jgi:acyl-CoA reductase-like NAD-dependent aldehyde dehydrogenase
MQTSVVKEKLFVNGQWIETNNTHKVYNKFSGELFSEVSIADKSIVDQAVEAAVKAHKETTFAPDFRYKVLMCASELLLENREEFAEIIAKEGGKPITDAKAEVNRSASTFQIAADETKKLVGEVIPNYNVQGRFLYTVKKPVGVVAAITPFNFPLNLVVHKVAPALAAGNPVILKPASDTATVAIKLCELLEKAGVPKGYLQCVVENSF